LTDNRESADMSATLCKTLAHVICLAR